MGEHRLVLVEWDDAPYGSTLAAGWVVAESREFITLARAQVKLRGEASFQWVEHFTISRSVVRRVVRLAETTNG